MENFNATVRSQRWTAPWFSVAGISPMDFGVYHFRKTFELPSRPGSFVVHVAGDHRYQLYVTGWPSRLLLRTRSLKIHPLKTQDVSPESD